MSNFQGVDYHGSGQLHECGQDSLYRRGGPAHQFVMQTQREYDGESGKSITYQFAPGSTVSAQGCLDANSDLRVRPPGRGLTYGLLKLAAL